MGDDEVRVVARKFDGSLHWHYSLTRLGEDEFGVWLGAPVGTRYDKGERLDVYRAAEARVMLVPHEGWWTAEFQAAPARLDAYCDVTTPSTWTAPDEVTMVDLDLDVCRVRDDMSVYVDDEDEFADHQVLYGYPADVVEKAEEAAAWLTAALRDGVEPFAGHYRSWLEWCSATVRTDDLRPA